MSITRSQIARQLLAEGGAPRKGFFEGSPAYSGPSDDPSFGDTGDFGSESENVQQNLSAFSNVPDAVGMEQTPRSPNFFERISDNLDDRRDRSIQSFVQRSSMKPRSAILSAITREKLPEELFIDLYREDEMNKGLFSEGLAGGRFDMEKTKNLLDKLEDKAGFDRTKSIKDQLNNMTQAEFDRVFPGPQPSTGGDNETLPLRIRKPITEAAKKEEPKNEFNELLKFYGARFKDGGEVREGYGLGSIVKKATRAVKKVAKSPIGKAALFAGLGAYGLGAGPFASGSTMFGGKLAGLKGSGFLRNFLLKDAAKKFALDNISPFGAITAASLAAGALSKQDEDDDEKLSTAAQSDPEFQNLLAYYGGPRRFAEKGGDIEDAPKKKPSGIMMASAPDPAAERNSYLEMLSEKYYKKPLKDLTPDEFMDLEEALEDMGMKPVSKDRMTAQEGGLMNLGGNEMDLRGGGFVPLGAKEKADDVPARLSKNEFVFTADAVRAAGGGSVDRGADIMYKTMKNLENKVA